MNALTTSDQLDDAAQAELISNRVFTGKSFVGPQQGALYLDCVFSNLDWHHGAVNECRFINCRFEQVRFSYFSGRELSYEHCQFTQVSWVESGLAHCHFLSCDASDCSWSRCDLSFVDFSATQGQSLGFSECRAKHLSGMDSTLSSLSFSVCNLADTTWASCDINGLVLEDCDLQRWICCQTKAAQVKALGCRGAQVRWTECELPAMQIDTCQLKQASWSYSQWSDGGIVRSTLPGACFDHATLQRLRVFASPMDAAMFDEAKIDDCDLRELHAPRASLRFAALQGVDLTGAQLSHVDGHGAALSNTRLHQANCSQANLLGQDRRDWEGAKLSGARFTEPPDLDDANWWALTQPGYRGELP